MSQAVRRCAAALAAGLTIVSLTACAPAGPGERAQEAAPPPAARGTERLQARSTALLTAIRDRNIEAVAGFIHPTKGVRLSPYAFVEMAEDQVLTADHLVEAWNDRSPRLWGVEDATGEPLSMSFADYLERFVYDADFLEAEQVAIGSMIGRGNTINNALEVYPEATIVEYHFSGFDPRYEGLDWRSLRLVFEESEGAWYVVGIIHDEWTS